MKKITKKSNESLSRIKNNLDKKMMELYLSGDVIFQSKDPKIFTPYPTRPIRMSDKTWEELKKQKLKTGKNWDTFISDILKEIK